MKLSSVWNFFNIFIGVVGIAGVIIGWTIGDRTLLGLSSTDFSGRSIVVLYIAIWLALTTLISLSKEDQE